jgi:hypothetical protein
MRHTILPTSEVNDDKYVSCGELKDLPRYYDSLSSQS